jgi:hypothetical protein
MRNALDKSYRDNQNTRFIFSNFFPENLAVFEINLKTVVGHNINMARAHRMPDN